MTHTAQSYDPEERRNTPLARKLNERLKRDKWMLVGEYVWICLDDPVCGYYRGRAGIGAAGDFVTAPEISQVFGELIGLWSAVVWQQMGCPKPFRLIELGPGKGTMMRDALRAMRIVPGLLEAVEVLLIDTDPALIAAQRAALTELAVSVQWLGRIEDLQPANATIVLGNEYLDTRGVQQYILSGGLVYERTVELDANDDFVFSCKDKPESFDIERLKREFGDLKDGTIIESQPNVQPAGTLKRIAAAGPMAALFIDYGQTGVPEVSVGDSLQAVRQHRYEHVFTSPGEADLTAQVNFTEVAQNALDAGMVVDGPTTQAEFLGRLGIIERASKLMGANPGKAGEIEAGVMRLMAPNGMGTRLKVIGIRSPNVAKLPGFE